MSALHDEDYNLHFETPERYRRDLAKAASQRGSTSSLRYSGRLSRCSSVRDEVQTLDEFLRKQRVIRYMQEERERAERTKILREEHDAWVVFRSKERSERLKFMTEQEIAELLQHEAEEIAKEKAAAEEAAQRAADNAIRRRQSLAGLRRQEEESLKIQERGEAVAKEAQGKIRRQATRERLVVDAEGARRDSLDLQFEKDSVMRYNRLEGLLLEARKEAADAKKAQERAEVELAQQRLKVGNAPPMSGSREKDLQGLVDALQKQLSDAQRKLSAAEDEKEVMAASAAQRDAIVGGLHAQLEALQAERQRLLSMLSARTKEEINRATRTRDTNAAAGVKCGEIDRQAQELRVLQKSVANMEKSNAANSAALEKARAEIQTERKKREKAEKEVARLQATAANANTVQQVAMRGKTQPKNATRKTQESARTLASTEAGDGASITALEKTIEELHIDRRKNADEIHRLKKELQETEKELQCEALTRAKFEELAAQAIDKENKVVPKEDVLELQRQLSESQRQLGIVQAEADALQQRSAREIQELKEWCARLKTQHEKQLCNREFTPRRSAVEAQSAPCLGQGTPRPAIEPRHASHRQETERLRAQVRVLQEQLRRSDEGGKKALADAEAFKTAANTDRTRNRVSEADLISKVGRLEEEKKELQRKYSNLFQNQKSIDHARCLAEEQLGTLRERIAQLEKDAESAAAHVSCVSLCGSAKHERAVKEMEHATGDAPAGEPTRLELEDHIRELEKALRNEEEARATAEERARTAAMIATNAEAKAMTATQNAEAATAQLKKIEKERASSTLVSLPSKRKQKSKCRCC